MQKCARHSQNLSVYTFEAQTNRLCPKKKPINEHTQATYSNLPKIFTYLSPK